MSDVRDVLEGVRRQVRPQPGSLERIHTKHAKRERNRKVGTVVVALVVALVAIGAVAQFLDLSSKHVPAPPGMTLFGKVHVSFPQHLAVTSGAIWTVSVFKPNTLDKIDPQTLEVTHIHLLPRSNPHDLVATAGSIWVVTTRRGLLRIDPATGQTVDTIPGRFQSIAAGFGSVWVGGESGTVRVDTVTNQPTEISSRPCGMTIMSVTRDSVWASCSNSTRRIDPTTLDVAGRIARPGRVLEAADNLWFSTGPDIFAVKHPKNASTDLYRVDPSTNQLVPGSRVAIVRGASSPMPLVDGTDIWFPCSNGVGS